MNFIMLSVDGWSNCGTEARARKRVLRKDQKIREPYRNRAELVLGVIQFNVPFYP